MTQTLEHRVTDDWWRTWFNNIYLDVYAHRDDNQAIEEVKTTLSVLPIQTHHQILDLCCGNGRHSRALYNQGFTNIHGIDYSYPLLKHARIESGNINYSRADMRMLPFHTASFDALLTFFTTFGYFKNNTENIGVLHEISRVLKPGGWFLMDYLNPAYVKAHFEPESAKDFGEFQITERRWFSGDDERIEKEINIQHLDGNTHTFFESVRLYSYDDMIDMLNSADLYALGCLGGFDGKAFELNNPRMILYGTRL
jgi:SAM-dependent methyltransferase